MAFKPRLLILLSLLPREMKFDLPESSAISRKQRKLDGWLEKIAELLQGTKLSH